MMVLSAFVFKPTSLSPFPPSGSLTTPSPVLPDSQSEGRGCYRLIPAKASPTPAPTPPGRSSTLKRTPGEGDAEPQGDPCPGLLRLSATGGMGRPFDTKKPNARLPESHKAQSSTAKWQKGRIKHPSI